MNWAEPTAARVQDIARMLRQQDQREVFFSHGMTGEDAVLSSWRCADFCRCIDGDDGSAVGICGVTGGRTIWLLGTDGLLATASHRRQFLRGARRWVDDLMTDHPLLENWALWSNRDTLRWLQWLGFTIDTPQPMGRSAQLFAHFWRKG
jgi:hypothetical protein